MKKYLILLLLPFLFLTPVKADTIFDLQYGGSNYSEYYYLNNLPYASYYIENLGVQSSCSTETECYNAIMTEFNNSNYQYYSITLSIIPSGNEISMNAYFFDFSSSDLYQQRVSFTYGNTFVFEREVTSGTFVTLAAVVAQYSDPNVNKFYLFYDSNFNFINHGDYIFQGFYDNENDNYNNMVQVHDGESMPKIKDLIQYSSWTDYEQNHLENYTEVNLDNYEYVLLSLKDYSQTQPFQTNFQVKGQIGITPIYNYGQTSKDAITGAQVQDRCNVSYTDYTTYPFYIIQSDIQNNAIYAVKSCSSGSSFKFDSTVFNITYVTSQNAASPTITIDGNTYNVIPYDDLPSTATENEENNYIPGQSGSANSIGGLDSAIKSTQQKMSEIWNTFTYFTDFINQLFTTLPSELRVILVSAFTISIVLGLIKIFVL